ncbi:hypothetical protein DRQ25_05705 [Candidatus Fermentibacteria bacterium]|nr:MAG: hypothetical protein DRQ25_05705 [Candidatus Fermentibacteria bacterium]
MRFLMMTLVAVTACLASSGGPDGGGYYWYDREESPDFFSDNWVDISNSGTYMGPGDDTYWFAGTLSFDFVFYGELSNDIYISSNGTIVFRDVYLGWGFTHFPSTNSCWVDALAAPWWCDLDASEEGGIYFQEFSDHFIVLWDDVPPWVESGAPPYYVTFMIIGWSSPDGQTNSDVAFLYNSSCSEPEGSSGMQGDPDNGTELQYMPLLCEPEDWHLLTPNADPFGTSSLERTTWASIKSLL